MKILKNISIYLILTVFIFTPIFSYAQPIPATPPAGSSPGSSSVVLKIDNPLNCASGQDCNSLLALLTTILNSIVMPIAVVAVVIWIIWAGFTYLMAQGNEKKIQEAHSRLLWSLIGAGVLLGAAGISAVVNNTITAVIK